MRAGNGGGTVGKTVGGTVGKTVGGTVGKTVGGTVGKTKLRRLSMQNDEWWRLKKNHETFRRIVKTR
jgi:outer membrane lipoprotein SlyB